MSSLKSLTAVCLLVASLSAALAQDVPSRAQAINGQHSNGQVQSEPAITMPGPKAPQPNPQPAPSADAPVELSKTQVYMFWATVKCRVIVSPDNGTVVVESSSGPNFKAFAEFPDSGGKYELRSRNEPYIWLVLAKKTGTVEVIVVPDDSKDADKFVRRTINAYVSPLPPVPPGPTPIPPGPTPPPTPITKGMRVVIVEESEDRSKLPAKQREILFDARIRDYLNEKCMVGPDGKTREWVIPDKDQDISGYSKELDALRRKAVDKPMPWIVIEGDGKVVHDGALPGNVDEALALLKRFGG